MEVTIILGTINHTSFSFKEAASLSNSSSSIYISGKIMISIKRFILLLKSSVLTSVEFGGELNLGLDLLVIRSEGVFCDLNTQLIFTSIVSFIFILNVRVNITIEELVFILVSQHESDTLVWCTSTLDESIIGNDQGLQDGFIHNLDLHLQSLQQRKVDVGKIIAAYVS